jgi:hypothetical protein
VWQNVLTGIHVGVNALKQIVVRRAGNRQVARVHETLMDIVGCRLSLIHQYELML